MCGDYCGQCHIFFVFGIDIIIDGMPTKNNWFQEFLTANSSSSITYNDLPIIFLFCYGLHKVYDKLF